MNLTGTIAIAAQILDPGTLYLVIGGGLIFAACAYAAKRILRQLTRKQIGLSTVVTLATIGLIWGFLTWSTRKREVPQPDADLNRPVPSLQPSPD
jgi:membrane protein implicated in regulation of membrane protease activity